MRMRIVLAATAAMLAGLLGLWTGSGRAEPPTAPTLTGEVITSFFQPCPTIPERFRIVTFDGQTTVEGTKTLVGDVRNTGVCQQYQNEQPPNNPRLGAPLTAYFYIANAQVLGYDARIETPAGTFHDTGSA